MKKILIVGYGTVGKNLHKELKGLNIDVYDKYKTENNTKKDGEKYDIAIICVDTPYVDKKNVCDISQVRNALGENDADIYIIKSTILPGTTDSLIEETGKNIIFSPEYYGSTHFTNNYVFDFTILGGDKDVSVNVAQELQNVYDGRHRFYFVDAKTAEICKYMENAFLCAKVSFCQEFFEVCEREGTNYEELRECFIADPRIGDANTYVFREHPYWKSHCYDKDVAAIAETYDMEIMKAVISFNEKQKEKYNA
ncbi:hypothetical protein IJI69_00470 [Candidatus Saccharibacteria bacterium]|nr:hypothetical protein [Candidatus Saccharibacteria bacterium]MBQ6127163.1 hypothetical protein [Candidatus Saccharibacteria bacterium]